MCDNASISRLPTCSTHRCAGGCVHLVWNNVTLHFFRKEWEVLVETILETERAIREEGEELPLPPM